MKRLFYNYWKHRQPKRNVVCRNWKHIRTILVLSTLPVPDIEAELSKEGKKVRAVQVPTRDQIRWTGCPRPEVLARVDHHVDLLLDLQQTETLEGNYMTRHADADLKAGLRRSEDNILDLMVDMPAEQSARPLFEQIRKYLTIING